MDYQEEKMMLDEAITHAREIAEKNYLQGMLCHANPDDEELDGCIECGREHEQLAEWLEELMQYKQIGTLDEVREAMERQKECKDCGYKNHSDRISELNSCNDCGLANICEKRPEYGQYCRINCYDWRCRNDR